MYEAAVYPYTKEFVPYISFDIPEMLRDICIKFLVSPRGFMLDGKNASVVDRRPQTAYMVTSDFEAAITDSTAMLIPDGNYNAKLYRNIINKALLTLQRGKHVICLLKLELKDQLCLMEESANHKAEFIYMLDDKLENYGLEASKEPLYRPDASIIFVGELVKDMNGIDIALMAVSHFKKMEYKVSAVLPSSAAGLFGMYNSDIIFGPNSNYSEEDKIILFNKLIRFIDINEAPDIIVIKLPGGMMTFNELLPNSFGIYAYMVSNAVTPDYFICSFPYDFYYSQSVLEKYSELFEKRFGYRLDCAHISNLMLDLTHLVEDQSFRHITVELEDVMAILDGFKDMGDIQIVNALSMAGRNSLLKDIENSLSAYRKASAL